jgi:hypothetical protein
MNRLIPLLAMCLAFLVSACAVPDEVTRAAPTELTPTTSLENVTAIVPSPKLQAAINPQTSIITRPSKPASSRSSVSVISHDNGGDLIKYAQRVSRARKESKQFAIDGRCASACTLFLSLEASNICVTPKASFLFHRAYGAKRDVNQWGTDYLNKQYPAWVKTWISERGGLTNQLLKMDFDYASQFMKTCKVA